MSSRVAKPKKTAKKDHMLAFKPEKPFSDEDWLAIFLQCVMMTGVKVATTMGVTTQYAKMQFLRLRKKFGFTHLVGSNLRGKVPTEAEDKDEDGEVKMNDGSFDGFTDDFPSEDVV